MSKILVPHDGSENSDKAFEYACYLAKRCEARLLIVHVCVEFGKAATTWREHDARAVTRVPNPITVGRSFPVDEWGIAISVLEIPYIMITRIILAKGRNRKPQRIKLKS